MARSRLRPLLVVLALSAVAFGVLLLCAPVLRESSAAWRPGRSDTLRFDEALVALCAAAATLATLWCWIGTVSLALRPATATGAAPRPGLALPRPLRRVVLVACGTALVAGGAGVPSGAVARPAQVAPGSQTSTTTAQDTGLAGLRGPGGPTARLTSSLIGLPLPDRAEDADRADDAGRVRARPSSLPVTEPRPPGRAEVLVRPGDCLWSIAERLATGSVDATWRALLRANGDRLDDPDLIRPGQRLVLPPSLPPRS